MQIHIARNGQQMGPFSLDEVNRQLAAGTLSLSDLAWYEGASGWAALSTVPGIGAGGGTGGPADASAGYAASIPPVSAPPPAMPVAAAAGASAIRPVASVIGARNEPLAIWSLVLSIVGLLGFCCGPVVGIAAVICGHLALSKIKTNPELEGRGLAVAGLIIGYFAICSWLLYLLFFGGIAVLQGLTEGVSK